MGIDAPIGGPTEPEERPAPANPAKAGGGGHSPASRLTASRPTTTNPDDAASHQAADDAAMRADDDAAMRAALLEAERALTHGDVPVGAVALLDGEIVASRHNERELRGDPTAHAELLAVADAAAALGTRRLDAVTLVVTLEPCAMCAGALVAARVGRLVFGAADLKAGACGSLYNLCADPRLNHEVGVTAGVRADEASSLLTRFFGARRGG